MGWMYDLGLLSLRSDRFAYRLLWISPPPGAGKILEWQYGSAQKQE